MSAVTASAGSARSSGQVHDLEYLAACLVIENVHSSSGECGVGPGRQHREVRRHVLAWRHPARLIGSLGAAAVEAAGNRAHELTLISQQPQARASPGSRCARLALCPRFLPRQKSAAGGSGAGLRLASGPGRWVLLATVLGSAMASIDATVVGIALPAIGRDFGASLAALQWVVTAYTLTLAGLLLFAGALGDRYGRRRVFLIGVIWFALASALCGLAVDSPMLIAARALQGVGAALLTPGSLAIIEASFHPDDRGKAIGAWSGFAGVGTAHRAVHRRLADPGGLMAADLRDQPADRRARDRGGAGGTSRSRATRTHAAGLDVAGGALVTARPRRASPTG